MEATIDNTGTMSPTSQLTPEHNHIKDIGTQMINVESMQQTISEQVRKSKNNGDETAVLELKSLLPMLAGLQSNLRKSFDAYARPLIRKLHIFNLPDELLMDIFEDLRGGISIRDKVGTKDIKSIRLTCRRFCDVSSHLLLYRLDVSVTHRSLNHLDEVSRHPTISKGIRSLWIRAALFKPLPDTLEAFVRQVIKILREDYVNDLQNMRDCFDEAYPGDPRSESQPLWHGDYSYMSQLIKDVGNRNDIMLSCTKYLEDETTPRIEDGNMATLRQVYSKYSRLWHGQKMLLQNGTFVASVSQAVARLPSGASMTITDYMSSELYTLSDENLSETYANVRDRLLEPSDWASEVTSLLSQPPIRLLYKLPNAIARSGSPLTKLRIYLDCSTEHNLRLSKKQAEDLVSAAEHLKLLEIFCHLKVRAPEEQVSLCNFASLLAKGTNLRSVAFGFGLLPKAEGLSVGPLLALLPWAKLRQVSLTSASIHCDELSELLKKLETATYIKLNSVCLRSGLWANLLDVLREKATCDSEVEDVSGKEDQGVDAVEFGRQVDRTYNGAPNPATRYIRGELLENPLRLYPAQDDMDSDDTDQDYADQAYADQDDTDQDDVDGTT